MDQLLEEFDFNPIFVGGGGKITPPTAYIENLKNWSGPKARHNFYSSKIHFCKFLEVERIHLLLLTLQ